MPPPAWNKLYQRPRGIGLRQKFLLVNLDKVANTLVKYLLQNQEMSDEIL